MGKAEKIAAGQVWEQRNLKAVKIDEVLTDHGNTPVRIGEEFWQMNGRYWDDKHNHSKDLIKRIS